MFEASQDPFPGVIFTHKDQFEEYRLSHSGLLDNRYKLEEKLASAGPVSVMGICPLTRQRTEFKTPVKSSARNTDAVLNVDWRNHQVCSRGLPMPDRALAHYAIYNSAVGHLGKVFYLSNHDGLSDILRPYCDSIERGDFATLHASSRNFDTILIVNQMEQQHDQGDTLRLINARLSEGGQALFSINLHYFDAKTVKQKTTNGIYWATGWDFLDRVAATNFHGGHAVNFWSLDTGYLGPFNFIFHAHRA